MFHAFHIGAVKIDPNLILSPMSGITNMAFRRLIKRLNPGSVGLVVSEFISVEGLSRQSLKSHQMMQFHPEERPVSIQVFGAEPEKMAMAADMVQEKGADILDINCGCPVPKVVKKGGGAELMRQAETLEKILRAVKSVLSIPFTVKIRAGWDTTSINAIEIAQLIENCGASMVAIHGRTRVQGYTGEANWDLIAQVKASVHIPVVGSGDIQSPQDAEHRLKQSGVDGLMIGRGALYNPWIFQQIRAYLHQEPLYQPSFLDRYHLLTDYAELLREILPPQVLVGKMKQIAAQITKGMRGGAKLRDQIMGCKTLPDIFEQIEDFFTLPNLFPHQPLKPQRDDGKGVQA